MPPCGSSSSWLNADRGEISNEKLRRLSIRQLIEEAQATVNAFRKSPPDIAKDYMLPPEE